MECSWDPNRCEDRKGEETVKVGEADEIDVDVEVEFGEEGGIDRVLVLVVVLGVVAVVVDEIEVGTDEREVASYGGCREVDQE